MIHDWNKVVQSEICKNSYLNSEPIKIIYLLNKQKTLKLKRMLEELKTVSALYNISRFLYIDIKCDIPHILTSAFSDSDKARPNTILSDAASCIALQRLSKRSSLTDRLFID